MLTRSSHASSAISTTSSHSSYGSRSSLPVTRSRKRKSNALQDDNVFNHLSTVEEGHLQLSHHLHHANNQHHNRLYSTSSSRRTRHSLSSTSDIRQYMTCPSIHLEDEVPHHRRRSLSRQSSSRATHAALPQPSLQEEEDCGAEPEFPGAASSRDYRRRLIDDYDTKSSISSCSSILSVGSSGSLSSHFTRRSSKRSSPSDRDSVLSGLSSADSRSQDSSTNSSTNNLGFKNGREHEGEVTDETQFSQFTGEDGRKPVRASPLPPVCFANCDELWELMCAMDLKYHKPPEIFNTHPVLSPQMRAILIDWMMDVCEAYKMHRETLYLAIDYLDRYLAAQKNIAKTVLQLIGITCLFVAAKLEEIYPPNLKTFAYVTDGACTESEILDMELVLMKTLKWKLTPITPVSWISIYLQVLAYKNQGVYCTRSGADAFLRSTLRPQDSKPDDARLVKYMYDMVEFVKVVRIVDLAILDTHSLQFSYSTMAAAALFHIKGKASALSVSGFKWGNIAPCVNWMAPFALITKRYDIPSVLPSVETVQDDARHLVQTNCINIDMMAEAEGLRTSKICSPLAHTSLLTPPRSSEKYHRKSLPPNKHL